MRKLMPFFAAAVLGSVVVSSAVADEVYLTDGDHLSGTVTSIAGGKMTLHSDVVGDIVIPTSGIKSFQTTHPIDMTLTDGTRINQQVVMSDPGKVAVVSTGLEGQQKLSVSDIETVNVPILTGSFQVGGSLARGNTFTDQLNAGFNVGVNLQKEIFTFTGEYNYGRTKDRTTGVTTATADRWDLDAKYQHYFSKKFYGYVDAEVTKDRIAFLDLRFTPSAGIGYQWLDKAPLKFGTEGGIAWIYEKYTNGTPTREDVALKLAYHLTYDFNSNVNLFNDVTYFPSLEHISYYLLNTDIGLHTKLTKKLFAELKIEWDYDSEPATGALKNDELYVASLGYTL